MVERENPIETAADTSVLTVSRPELLRDGSDDSFRDLVHALLAFSARLEAVRQEFGRYVGLSGVQYTILISVGHLQRGRGVGVSAVADHLSLSGTFVTTQVGEMVRAGLIEKRTNPDDRRRVLLSTTARADALLRKLAPVQSDVNDVLFEPIGAAEFDVLVPLARQLAAASGQALQLCAYLTGTKESKDV